MTALKLESCAAGVTTLGPGPAVCIWVQGCDLGCRGCMSKHTWSGGGGVLAEPDDVAAWAESTRLRHLTISGGEPFDQAPALAELLDRLRASRDWVVTSYSGYRRPRLERDDPPGSVELLSRLDLLIDGPYVAARHAALRWRGSSNQTIHDLTGRVEVPSDAHAGLEVAFDEDGGFALVGVPPVRDFVARFEAGLPGRRRETAADPTRRFPFPTRKVL